MAMTMHCNIVSAEEKLFDGRIELLVASGVMGELGILPGHAPLLTELKPGSIKVTKQGGAEELIYVTSGFIEVQSSVVTVLADSAERAADLDEAAAQKALATAREAFNNLKGDGNFEEAAAYLAQATAKVRIIQQLKHLGR